MTKKAAAQFVRRIEAERKALGVVRDRLRALEGELADLAEAGDEAEDGLQQAVDALSRYA